MDEKEEITFESAMKRLESIVETLGGTNLSLEDSLKMFEEGMELCKFCNKKLDEAEYKVEKLMEKESGELKIDELKVEE